MSAGSWGICGPLEPEPTPASLIAWRAVATAVAETEGDGTVGGAADGGAWVEEVIWV